MEHERKFLLEEIPEGLGGFTCSGIEQFYLVVAGDREVRARRKDGRFSLTFKQGRSRSRKEVEISLSAGEYRQLACCSAGAVIHKNRFDYPLGELTAEIDVYQGELEGLAVVEVEFPCVAAMEAFEPPGWFGEEVSAQADFSNRALALEGLPDRLDRGWKKGRRPAWHFRQSGALPFRRAEGQYEVLLVTTRRSGSWTLPRGIVEPGLSPEASAVKEAWEEAGVKGELAQGLQQDLALNRWKRTCAFTLYLLAVNEEFRHWPEEQVRRRKWIPQGGIGGFIKNRELSGAAAGLLDQLATMPEEIT